jgi:2-polyprenyl-6-methoxyphenol hydroxylase-like FAD-dependent oxidoreductase
MRNLLMYSFINIHRADFQQLLVETAKDYGATVYLNSGVSFINESGTSPSVVTHDGRIFQADLIIAADGE